MREIAFKAKRKDWKSLPKEKWWVEGYLSPCVVVGKWHICRIEDNLSTTQIEIDLETICQYTGITDKNNKKIFENDKVVCSKLNKYGNIKYEFKYGYIILKNGAFGVQSNVFEEDFIPFYNLKDYEYEVIGNICDEKKGNSVINNI